ncbi:hypothetical protein F2Q69_00010865 [Brassica cretica]|uniref:Uncharacterized protein n=1 Tax=Brassica cretica TaxID=69181 RepID=A0A8S9QJQ2_BRACR|nr:hypothetical protein F2Q69_00010865 [Brassica cretica]
MWGGTYSIGSGKVEFTYFNGGLSLALGPKPFDISSALHEGRRLSEFLWIFLMKFLRGTNLRECSRFRARGRVSLHWKLVVLCLRQDFHGREVVQFLGLKPTVFFSGLLAVLCMVLERVSLVEQF